jgi:hypothetical protein
MAIRIAALYRFGTGAEQGFLSTPVNGQLIYVDLQTEVDGNWLDPGPAVYHAATELTLTLTPSSVSPSGTVSAEVNVGYAIEGPAFTVSLYETYPPTCRPIILEGKIVGTMCTPGLSVELYSAPSFAIEPVCLSGLLGERICLDLPISFTDEFTAPPGAGTYTVTAYLTPVGSSSAVASATQQLIVP